MNEALEQIFGYIRAVWRRRWVILGTAWLVALVGWVYVYFLENRYAAQARVYVDTQSLLRPLMSGLAVQPNTGQQIAMVTRTLASRPNLEKVARMTDLDLRAKTPKQQEILYNDLANAISLEGSDRENLYTIRYQNTNPDVAKRVVQALLTIFTESSLGGARKDISTTQKFLEDQLASYQTKMLEKEKEIEAFKLHNINTMPGQGGDFYSKLSSMDMALEQAKLELEEASNRKKQLQQQLEDQEEVLSMPLPGGVTSSVLDGRISALQSQIDNLRLRYTDLHPEIARTKHLVDRLLEQKKREDAELRAQPQGAIKAQNPVYQQLSVAIAEADANEAAMKARVKQLQGKRNALFGSADSIPVIEHDFAQMQRDLGVMKQNYDALLTRRESVLMSGEVESKTDSVEFRVIDPPRVPNKPSWPNRPLFVTAVPLVGIGLGIALAFLLSQLRPSIDNRRQLLDLTSFPLLGMVSLIETEQAKSKRRRSNLMYVAASSALAMALLAQIIYYFVLSPAA